MKRSEAVLSILMLLVANGAASASAPEPLRIEILPSAGSTVHSGSNYLLRIGAPEVEGELRVIVGGKAMTANGEPGAVRVGESPIEVEMAVPWEQTGPFTLFIVAEAQDPATGATKSAEADHSLFAIPDPGEVPVKLHVYGAGTLGRMLPSDGSGTEEPKRVRVTAIYADGRERPVELGAFGTTYVSSDPGIASVDADGRVTALAPGTAFVRVDYLGVRDFVEVSVRDPDTDRVPIIEYTDQVVLNTSGFRRDPESGLYVQEVSFMNQTQWPIPQPIYLMMTDLAEGVEVANSVGRTDKVEPLGSPVLDVDIPDGPSWLAPGATGTAVLRFRNRQNVPITYKLRLFGALDP